MQEAKKPITLKRIRGNYRLVVKNEDSFEELVSFKLTRTSVYFLISTIFVLLVGLTASLIIFTPLKYYLPGVGYGNAKEVREFKALKIRTDSMEHKLILQDKYVKDIQEVLSGNIKKRDTVKLALPKTENLDD